MQLIMNDDGQRPIAIGDLNDSGDLQSAKHAFIILILTSIKNILRSR